MGTLENYDKINVLLNFIFNTNIVVYPSIGLVLLLHYIAEFSTSMVLVLYCMQKASITHHWLLPLFSKVWGASNSSPQWYEWKIKESEKNLIQVNLKLACLFSLHKWIKIHFFLASSFQHPFFSDSFWIQNSHCYPREGWSLYYSWYHHIQKKT